MYQLQADTPIGAAICLKRLLDEAYIPFSLGNTDYQKFKVDVANGAELHDADGNLMTQEQVDEFLTTIP